MRTRMDQATRRPSNRRPVLLLGMLVLVATLLLVVPAVAEPAPLAATTEQVAAVQIAPSSTKANVGDVFTVTVQLSDVQRLYGFQYKLFFDPNILQVVDADAGQAGVQIKRSEAFAGLTVGFESNTVYNATGLILHGISLTESTEGASGPAELGQITFEAIAEGVTPLRFSIGVGQSRVSCLEDFGTTTVPVAVPTTWSSGDVVVGEYRVMLPYTNGAGAD